MTENHAYIVRGDDGVEYGPVSLAELRDWVAENRVGLGTDVRPDSAVGDWHPWQFYPELIALLAEVRVMGVPPLMPVLAPFGRRILAAIADLLMSSLVAGVVLNICRLFIPEDIVDAAQRVSEQIIQGTAAPVMPPAVMYVVLGLFCVSFVVQALYYACFHAVRGRTPAKAIMHIHVVDAAGRKPTFLQALVRGFVYVLSLAMYGIPLFFVFFNPQRRALHDLAAGTYVVEL